MIDESTFKVSNGKCDVQVLISCILMFISLVIIAYFFSILEALVPHFRYRLAEAFFRTVLGGIYEVKNPLLTRSLAG
jgi:hypothetical protein